MNQPQNAWLPYRTPRSSARVRLFCFPYAGGGASVYRSFSKELSAAIDLCAVQLPGREGRLQEPPFFDLMRLIPLIADGVAPYLVQPFAFFGHSMGALIAFELARELRRRGWALPVHLFVSACAAPHIPDTDQTHKLNDDQLIEQLRSLGGMSDELLAQRELMAMLIPVIRADAAISECYLHQTEKPLPIPIKAFCGTEDPKAPRVQMEAWREHTSQNFSIEMLQGGHMFIQGEDSAVITASVSRTLIGSY